MAAGVVTTAEPSPSDGAATTLVCPVLEQRVALVGSGRRWTVADGSETLFVADGEGVLRIDGEEHTAAPWTGAFARAGETVEVESSNGPLRLVIAAGPDGDAAGRRVVRYDERQAEDAGIGRQFRLLACSSGATQFVGVIPPGRAKMHNHPYDEVAYLLEGEGALHWEDGTSVPVGPGSCIFFPRLVFHSLENAGSAPMRIMGVFHPAGSPADRVQVLDY